MLDKIKRNSSKLHNSNIWHNAGTLFASVALLWIMLLPIGAANAATATQATLSGIVSGQDITAALQEAINTTTAAGGGEVNIPAGNFKLQGPITLSSAISLVGATNATTGAPATTIDMSGITSTPIIANGCGYTATEDSLAANALSGATSIRLASSSGLTYGDYVNIRRRLHHTGRNQW